MKVIPALLAFTVLPGGPTITQDGLDSYYTVNLQKQTQQELVFNVTAEGLPLPVITWRLGNDIIEGAPSYIKQHEVRSEMQYNFTKDDCGKDISYEWFYKSDVYCNDIIFKTH